MRYSSWDEIEPTATPAERELKTRAETGKYLVLSLFNQIPSPPEDWRTLEPTRHIRADVLRFLILSDTTTENGLMLMGAYISGHLDLSNLTITSKCSFMGCRFEGDINLTYSTIHGIFQLKNSSIASLCAVSANLLGPLNCSGAEFLADEGFALDLQSAEIKGGMFLRGAKLKATAHLSGAQIEGHLDCNGAKFLVNKGTALNLQGIRASILQFLDIKTDGGVIDLTSAHVDDLTDDPDSWPTGQMVLNGFTYKRIHGPTDAQTRLKWLEKGERSDGVFFPQPYKQLAKVLHDMGHEADAREVLFTLEKKLAIERQNTLRQDIKTLRQTAPETGLDIARLLTLGMERGKDWLLRSIIGYGYKPFRSLAALVLLVCLFWLFTLAAWHTGGFAPNSGVILTSPDWTALGTQHPNAAAAWAALAPAGQDWESFSSFAYALDVVIPIIEFGQTDAWAPSTSRGLAGSILWWARWPFTIAGWIVTALGAAALTGIIRRE